MVKHRQRVREEHEPLMNCYADFASWFLGTFVLCGRVALDIPDSYLAGRHLCPPDGQNARKLWMNIDTGDVL